MQKSDLKADFYVELNKNL